MPELRCSVIIPARDEAGAITEVVQGIFKTLPAEVIVVDNNSRDGTAEVAAQAGARVVSETARGYGHACLRGIAAATTPDVIVFIDGDGSMAPEDIPSLLAPIAAGQADVVCGSRRRRAAPGSMPQHQAFGNWLAVSLLRVLYGVRLTDLGPFRAARASTLQSLQMQPSRFAFLAEMLARAARRGARIVEVDVGYQPRVAGRSKVGGSLRGSLEAGTEIIASLVLNRFSASAAAWIAGWGATALFFFFGWLRYASFHSTAYDLGFFDQVVWNAAHGHGLASSFLAYSFFGQHFEPALLLFVPLYALHATPLWLLLGQSVALGLAVVPLFALARGFISERLAWLLVAAYLLQLAVSRTVAFDYHTEALAVPFVFLALLALKNRCPRLFIAAGILPLLCKEDGALISFALGVFALLLFRRRIAVVLSAFAITWGAIVLLAIMPAYRHGMPGDLIARYQYLGASPAEVALHLFTQPGTVLAHMATDGAPLALLLTLVGLGFLPLLRPWLFLPALIPLGPGFLSADPDQARLAFHYGIGGVPLLIVAALLGLQRIAAGKRWSTAGARALVTGSVAVFVIFSPLPRALHTELPELSRQSSVKAALSQIPQGSSVAASTSLVAHLSERHVIDELPCGAGHTEWVVVDHARAPSSNSQEHGYATAIAGLPALGYRRVADSGGVTTWYSAGAAAQAPAICFPSR